MNEQHINLSIERLVLDGISLPHSQRPLVKAAIEAELAHLLSSDGLAGGLQSGVVVPSIAAGSIQLSSDGNPHTLGQSIAHAVYQGIGGAKR